jgi:hypothetical protein
MYDLKMQNKTQFNQLKRIFYYNLAKLNLGSEVWKTKSAFVVPVNRELEIDAFFRRFRGDIKVYKCFVYSVEDLL